MSWLAVARNDIREAVRSKGVWALTGLFLVGLAGLAFLLARLAVPDFDVFLDVTAIGVTLLFPLVGVVLGYRTVVAERESGTIVLLMSLPNSRAEMVLGKILGRTTVLTGSLVVGTVGAGLVLATQYPSFAPGRYLLFVLAALVYGLGFVAIATALSMALSTARRVVGAAFGVYVLLVMVWNVLVDVLVAVLFRFEPEGLADPPLWAESVTFLTPRTTFEYLVSEALGVGGGPTTVAVDSQWFASTGVAVVVLLGWVVVPLLVGYARFERAEF